MSYTYTFREGTELESKTIDAGTAISADEKEYVETIVHKRTFRKKISEVDAQLTAKQAEIDALNTEKTKLEAVK